MSALRLHTPVILLALMTLLLPATPVWAAVTDYYVDAANGDDGNMGTSGFPFATIHQGIAQVVSDGVPGRVFVREGTYDNDHESTYAGSNPGYPIDLSNGVEVIGDEEDPEDWPRIGGDVSASTAETYFRVVLDTGATWEGIRVENLYFEGESPSGDAPTAFYARVTNESELLGAAFVGNICERPVQASATRAVVALEAGDGGVLGDGEEGEWILISDNIITASRLGGIEIRTLTDEAGL